MILKILNGFRFKVIFFEKGEFLIIFPQTFCNFVQVTEF